MSENPNPESGASHKGSAALSRALSEFLLEFSIGVHRYSMYPPDHPSLGQVAESVLARLGEVLATRPVLTIGVGRDQLMLDGRATEAGHPVLRELARRVHEHQLGAVALSRGTDVREVQELLQALARDPGRGGEPLGLLPPGQIPDWDHVRLFPVGYDQLELRSGGSPEELPPDPATDLWIGLARAAAGGGEKTEGETNPEPGAVARSIRNRPRGMGYDQVIVGYLLRLARELKEGTGRESESIRDRVSSLVNDLDEGTLREFLKMGGSVSRQHRFVLDANESLASDSVVKLLKAAADSSQQTISHSLLRLLSKLSSHADSGGALIRNQAEAAFRENVEALVNDWELKDPNPDEYTLILDSMARAAPILQTSEEEEPADLPGAHRLLNMSIELDTWGPVVAKAVSDLMSAGEVSQVLRLVDSTHSGSRVSEQLMAFMTSPGQLRRLLGGEDVHEGSLVALAQRMGEDAIPTLLDVLTESESRSIRRKVFDVLAKRINEVAPQVLTRLDDPRWYVLRNMLALLRGLPENPRGFSAAAFLEHEDVRVRREAFALAIREPALRERTLATGLADPDERTLRMALVELQKSLPETLVPTLVSRVIRSGRDPDLRAMAIRALRHSHSNLALETLLEACAGGKSILGRVKLPPTSSEVLAALGVLAEVWSEDRRSAAYLNAARRARDPRIREVLSGKVWNE